MGWKEFIYHYIEEYCDQRQREFELREFQQFIVELARNFRPGNQHVDEKVRQQLQFLVKDGKLTRTSRGVYAYTPAPTDLAEINLEVNLEQMLEGGDDSPEKREHIRETYLRNSAVARRAKILFGRDCFCKGCPNTFSKPDGTPYIEIHHIKPLFEGGKDKLDNLAPVCGHHHRMAHFADPKKKRELHDELVAANKHNLSQVWEKILDGKFKVET